jgi:hypothetical protein
MEETRHILTIRVDAATLKACELLVDAYGEPILHAIINAGIIKVVEEIPEKLTQQGGNK